MRLSSSFRGGLLVLCFAVLGVVFRFAVDFGFVFIGLNSIRFRYVGPPIRGADDVLRNTRVEEHIPFSMTPDQLRIAMLVLAIPLVLAIAYGLNRILKPSSFVWFVLAAVACVVGFLASQIEKLAPFAPSELILALTLVVGAQLWMGRGQVRRMSS